MVIIYRSIMSCFRRRFARDVSGPIRNVDSELGPGRRDSTAARPQGWTAECLCLTFPAVGSRFELRAANSRTPEQGKSDAWHCGSLFLRLTSYRKRVNDSVNQALLHWSSLYTFLCTSSRSRLTFIPQVVAGSIINNCSSTGFSCHLRVPGSPESCHTELSQTDSIASKQINLLIGCISNPSRWHDKPVKGVNEVHRCLS